MSKSKIIIAILVIVVISGAYFLPSISVEIVPDQLLLKVKTKQEVEVTVPKEKKDVKEDKVSINEGTQGDDKVKDSKQASEKEESVDTDNSENNEQNIVDNEVEEKKPSLDEVIYRINLGRTADISILIDKGISVDEVNASGVPIIALAAGRSDSESLGIVKLLVENGADINKADIRGQNALFYAAKVGNTEVVKYLLSKKINYNATDASGNNARTIAFQTGNNKVIEVLDNFIQQQNILAKQQYEKINKEINEKYKSYNETMTKINAKNKALTEADRLKQMVKDFSFASCSAAYWQFCRISRQTTEFGGQELINVINSQFNKSRELAGELESEHKIEFQVIQNISSASERNIRNELSKYPSSEARTAAGVGSSDDMKMRCAKMADAWNIRKQDDNRANSYMNNIYNRNRGYMSPNSGYGSQQPSPYQNNNYGGGGGQLYQQQPAQPIQPYGIPNPQQQYR
ncbi:MAG: ankyrin repeat domain-containing protein [Rickettsiales bacterium]